MIELPIYFLETVQEAGEELRTSQPYINALVTILIGFPLVIVGSRLLARLIKKKVSEHASFLARRLAFYIGCIFVVITILGNLGFNLTAILGAAGIISAAIGFASSSSISNIISGLFLIWEKPFQIGDAITVGGHTGSVYSFDLLSIKLRTFDNRFVRIPNTQVLTSDSVNITKFPIRRLDINVGVDYKEDIPTVVKVLREVADRNPLCLDEPEPVIIFTGYGDSSLDFMLGVWFSKTDMLALRNSIMQEIKKSFDQAGISIPFPHRTLYAGDVTKPFPVQVIQGKKAESDRQDSDTTSA